MDKIVQTILCCPKCRGGLSVVDKRTFCSMCGEDVFIDDRFIDFERLNPKLHLDLDDMVQGITESAGAKMKDVPIDWRVDAVLKDIKKAAKGSVCLEIGGADGPMTPTIENLFERTLTLDYSKEFLKRIQDKTQRTCCIYSNAHFLPIQNNVVDMVICCEVLEHSTIPTQFLTEIRRTTREDGLILLSVPNEQTFYYKKKRSSYDYTSARDTHINFFTPDTLAKLLFRTGLEIIWMKTIYPPVHSLRDLLSNIKNSARKCFSGNYIVCLMRPMDNPRLYWDTFSKRIRS